MEQLVFVLQMLGFPPWPLLQGLKDSNHFMFIILVHFSEVTTKKLSNFIIILLNVLNLYYLPEVLQ